MRQALKEAREKKNMTQQQVADTLGLSLRQYQRIEGGDCDGTLATWDRLEDMFRVHQRKLREIV